MGRRILIIDDEPSIRETLSGILEDEGFVAFAAESAETGIDMIEEEQIDLVLLDIWLGENMDGMTALDRIMERYGLPVIMISGHGTIETAVQATRRGAFDFIEKPLSYDKVILSVTNGLRISRLERENRLLQENRPAKVELIGESAAMQALKQQIGLVAPTDAWVLIRGEHGTGKELVAQTIHRLSHSADRPMVEVNCAAIPEELIESELFGHEKGSFTGAHTSRRGRFDQADGGILFLDEIGDMSLKTQAKILRILQEQKFERVGGSRTIKVSVRVLAATNKNLEEEIERGTFRADLFWRLNVVPIVVPPLRERLGDIPLVVESVIRHHLGREMAGKSFTEEAFAAMQDHSWPGNVRELRNFIERLAIMCREDRITGELVARFLAPSKGQRIAAGGGDAAPSWYEVDFREARRLFETEYLQRKLRENDNNISRTAEVVGLERSHLHKKLKSLGLIQ